MANPLFGMFTQGAPQQPNMFQQFQQFINNFRGEFKNFFRMDK